jgi:hypothetical protein
MGTKNMHQIMAVALVALALLGLTAAVGAQGFSHILSFQGRLCGTDGKPLPDGPYVVQFKMYDAKVGGSSLWTETQGVTQIGGLFVAYLGSVTAFPGDLFTGGDRWLAIQAGQDPEMSTRFRLTPSPWAIYAAKADEATNADTVDGFHASNHAAAGKLLTLDANVRWPLWTIPQHQGSRLDADLLDGLDASDFWSKAEGGPFVELAPSVPQAGAEVAVVGGGAAPALTLENEGLALRAIRTDGQWSCVWQQMTPPAGPSARRMHAMAYDAESDRVILFGGQGGSTWGDTWAYDYNTNTWTQMTPATAPSARYHHAMAYDAESDRVILFGGYGGSSSLGDTWAYDYNTNTWTQMSPPTAPSARYRHAMAYDARSDRVVLFGGFGGSYLGDTWAYDYNTNTWTLMNPGTAPSTRCEHAMAYDAGSDRTILFGGTRGAYLGDTWAYDCNANTWTLMGPAAAPSFRDALAMAYDAQIDRIILFGGYNGAWLGDTWGYDWEANTWTQMVLPTAPGARYCHAMAYDAESDRVILFGGHTGTTYLGDTWALGGVYEAVAAEFRGSVYIAGDLLVDGEKNAIVPTASFGERKVYCQESTEVWFEHIGRGQLENGVATVDLDPIFLETVTIDSVHPMEVFITPYCPIGEYWVEPGRSGFTVRAKSEAAIGEFGYRVVAKRRGYEEAVLEPTGRGPQKNAR